MTPEEEDTYRRKQRSRALVMALGLAGLVLLFYLITIAKLSFVG